MLVYVEQGEIKGRFMSIIMNPMPALITTILDSLKYAVAAGNHLPCVLALSREQINMDQVLNLHVCETFAIKFSYLSVLLLTNCSKMSLTASPAYMCFTEEI